jgi:hypothetical protein
VPALGDLSELSSVVAGEQPEAEVDPDYRLDDAGARTVIDGVTERLARLASPPPPEGNARPVEMIDTAELVKIAWYRVLRRGRAKVGVGYVRPSVD